MKIACMMNPYFYVMRCYITFIYLNVCLLFVQLGSQEFSSKEVLPICATPLGAAATVRAHGTARSMRDKAEETMSRERSHVAFVVLSCATVLLTLLGVCLLYTSPSPRDRG